jgi:hypothetical protein
MNSQRTTAQNPHDIAMITDHTAMNDQSDVACCHNECLAMVMSGPPLLGAEPRRVLDKLRVIT